MTPSISILIPAFGAAEKLRVCLDSLAQHAPPASTVYVIDDATPDDSIRATCEAVQVHFPRLHYARSDVNRGFVRTCNWACAQLGERESDVLLLNSDTEATPGFLEEMQAVLYLHEKHGVVSPRSNNATIFSIPWNAPVQPAESHELWQRIHQSLPRYQVMPTAVGFCMLIKREVLERFELFDEIYSPGYNEENDFICRINRCGYSAVAANWSYVFHYQGSSFGPRRSDLEIAHRGILLERYPEYERKVADYGQFHVDPVETFAILYAPHRPRILYDLYHFPDAYTGTTEFALNLLRELARLLEKDYDLYVGIRQTQRFFAHELAGYRTYEEKPGDAMVFDLIYKPCQIFYWSDFSRINRLAPRVSYALQDIIAVRSDYLSDANTRILFRKTAELADCVFTISDFSRSDFAAFYGSDAPMRVIHHGTNAGIAAGEFGRGEYVLVIGNAFLHKGIGDALRYLDGNWPVVVLGGEDQGNVGASNVRWLGSGQVTRQHMRQLFVNARVLVYPSHYEGFGLPVVDALALGKPVVVLDNAVNREVAEMTGDGNLHRIRSLKELPETVQRLFHEMPHTPDTAPRSWRDAAEEYVAAFREILARDIDVDKLRARWDFLRTLEAASISLSAE